jgi:hypothetical protein
MEFGWEQGGLLAPTLDSSACNCVMIAWRHRRACRGKHSLLHFCWLCYTATARGVTPLPNSAGTFLVAGTLQPAPARAAAAAAAATAAAVATPAADLSSYPLPLSEYPRASFFAELAEANACISKLDLPGGAENLTITAVQADVSGTCLPGATGMNHEPGQQP